MTATIDSGRPAPAAIEFTPSEVVLLKGEAFARTGRVMRTWYSHRLLLSDETASGDDMSHAAIAVALLAGVRRGVITLSETKRKALFGLRNVPTIWARLGSAPANWPRPSLEMTLVEHIARQPEGISVNELLRNLLDMSSNPWYDVLAGIQRNLLARDVLVEEEVRTKGLLREKVNRTVSVPDATRAAIEEADVAYVQKLLAEHEQTAPEAHKLLLKEISGAVASRRESDDLDFD